MRTLLGRIVLVILGMLLGSGLAGGGGAAAQPQTIPTRCLVNVPSDWGALKGVSDRYGLVFEDSSGTLRFVNQFPCGLEQAPNMTMVVQRR